MDRKWWTLVAVVGGIFMLLLDVTIVNVALPDIEQALDASLADLQWVIDAYALTLAALLLTAGSLADRYGRRCCSRSASSSSPSARCCAGWRRASTFLSLSRAFQGIGGAIMFATGLALLSRRRSAARTAAWPSASSARTTGVAVAVGPVLGGALTSGLSWRWIFLVNIPVGIATLIVTLRAVDESRDAHARPIDFLGLGTFSLGLAALVYGLIRSSEDGWGVDHGGGFAGRGRGAARRVRRRRGAAAGADVRPQPVQEADLRRRLIAGLRDLGLAVQRVPVPGASTCRPASACPRSRSACASSCFPARSSSPPRSPAGSRTASRRAC